MLAAVTRLACVATAVAALALPAAAAEQSFVSIVAVQTATGWFFETEVDGPPGRSPTRRSHRPPGLRSLSAASPSGDGDSCYRTDPPEGGAGFASLAALLAAYPAGSYLLSLDGGALTAQLDFAPLEPDGTSA